MSHYYTDNKDLASNPCQFTYYFDNETFTFTTDNGVFSKKAVDYGSYLLIKTIYKLNLGTCILDLGCGWGPVGIILKRFNPILEVCLVDVNSRAIDLAKENAIINKTNLDTYLCEDINTLDKKFDSIILNPPIRAGKKVIYDLYEKSRMNLNVNGSLFIVIQKKQGAKSSIEKLESLFDDVKILDKDGGYYVIQGLVTH